MDRSKLVKGLIFGGVIGFVAIGLFVFLFTVALAGWEQPARLFASFFAPIVFIGIAIVVYHFLTR